MGVTDSMSDCGDFVDSSSQNLFLSCHEIKPIVASICEILLFLNGKMVLGM